MAEGDFVLGDESASLLSICGRAYYRLHHRHSKAGANQSKRQAKALDGSVEIARNPGVSSFARAVYCATKRKEKRKCDDSNDSVDQSDGRIVVPER
jgi:hypothetical protein